MEANIIKGPMYEQSLEKSYELLYQIIAKKVRDSQKKDIVERAS